METASGYAKEASNEYKKTEAEMKEALKKNDIVICINSGKPAKNFDRGFSKTYETWVYCL